MDSVDGVSQGGQEANNAHNAGGNNPDVALIEVIDRQVHLQRDKETGVLFPWGLSGQSKGAKSIT